MTENILSKGERARLSIMNASYRLFIEQGYHATSMRQIAREAGMALGSIYNHFPSKEEVYKAILADRHPYHQILPVLLAAEGDTVEEFVHNAARALIDELGQHPDFLNLMLIEIVEFEGRNMVGLFQTLIPNILELGERFIRVKGRVRLIPTPILLRAFLGMFFSYYITDILVGEVMPADMQADAFNQFVDIYLHGVLASQTE
jgi:AcrR family transcriptional regulator